MWRLHSLPRCDVQAGAPDPRLAQQAAGAGGAGGGAARQPRPATSRQQHADPGQCSAATLELMVPLEPNGRRTEKVKSVRISFQTLGVRRWI